MNEVNSIVICRDRFSSQEEFEDAIKRAVMVLLENDYIMTIRWDKKGLGILVIEYDKGDCSIGGLFPYWLYPEEWESVVYNDEKELANEVVF